MNYTAKEARAELFGIAKGEVNPKNRTRNKHAALILKYLNEDGPQCISDLAKGTSINLKYLRHTVASLFQRGLILHSDGIFSRPPVAPPTEPVGIAETSTEHQVIVQRNVADSHELAFVLIASASNYGQCEQVVAASVPMAPFQSKAASELSPERSPNRNPKLLRRNLYTILGELSKGPTNINQISLRSGIRPQVLRRAMEILIAREKVVVHLQTPRCTVYRIQGYAGYPEYPTTMQRPKPATGSKYVRVSWKGIGSLRKDIVFFKVAITISSALAKSLDFKVGDKFSIATHFGLIGLMRSPNGRKLCSSGNGCASLMAYFSLPEPTSGSMVSEANPLLLIEDPIFDSNMQFLVIGEIKPS